MRTARRPTPALPMLAIPALLVCAAAIARPGLRPHSQPTQSSSPPYHVAGPVSSPQVFAEGIISTEEDEIGGAFNADGTEFYFTRLVAYTTLPRLGILCVSHFRDGRWTPAEVLPFSGKYLDYPPRFDSTGTRLLFASSRPLPDGVRGHIRIWEVDRTPTGWGQPRPLPAPVNAPDNIWNGDPAESSDGTLYFSSDRGSAGNIHIFHARRLAGNYSEPEKLGPEINSEFNDYQPFISPDGNVLIFASSGEGEPPYRHRPEDIATGGQPYPRSDLYLSVKRNGKWSPARHLEHGINTFAEEEFPFLTPDGKYLFFSSERSPFTVPTAHRLDYQELESHLHSVFNGHGNVFYIGAAALELPQ
jgi:WD40-like Beta Propeller Repeat